jgi:carbonic anhydrase/acetyltransferase-like protein (isoleucine patch superfamily)
VTQRTIVPPGSMVLGTPAKVVRTLSAAEQAGLREWAMKYVTVSAAHARAGR